METSNTGDMLRDIFGSSSLSTMDDYSKNDSYPQSKVNALGLRTDLCGEVHTFTREYNEGWRFFDSYACLYKEDGTGKEPNHDLIGNANEDDLSPKPSSCYTWVHPDHLTISSLFPVFEAGRSKLIAGRYYLNRMGFVVFIEGSPTDVPKSMVRDTHGNLYYATGRRHSDKMSMTDLVYEIADWNHFSQSDWSGAEIVKNGAKERSAAYYDPAAESKEALLRRFYDALANAHGIAKKLGAVFTFAIDTKGS